MSSECLSSAPFSGQILEVPHGYRGCGGGSLLVMK
jgi:hypothetical protein